LLVGEYRRGKLDFVKRLSGFARAKVIEYIAKLEHVEQDRNREVVKWTGISQRPSHLKQSRTRSG
jgi:hypothetical protein